MDQSRHHDQADTLVEASGSIRALLGSVPGSAFLAAAVASPCALAVPCPGGALRWWCPALVVSVDTHFQVSGPMTAINSTIPVIIPLAEPNNFDRRSSELVRRNSPKVTRPPS